MYNGEYASLGGYTRVYNRVYASLGGYTRVYRCTYALPGWVYQGGRVVYSLYASLPCPVGVHPAVYHPMYTPGTPCCTMHRCQHPGTVATMRSDEALGSREKKPMGGEKPLRRVSFLLRLVGTLRVKPSGSLRINVKRLDTRRDYPHISPMVKACCAESSTLSAIRSLRNMRRREPSHHHPFPLFSVPRFNTGGER